MESAGDSPPNRKVSGFLAQEGSPARSLTPGPNQALGMASPASALGASLRPTSGTLVTDFSAGQSSASNGIGEVTTCLVTLCTFRVAESEGLHEQSRCMLCTYQSLRGGFPNLERPDAGPLPDLAVSEDICTCYI